MSKDKKPPNIWEDWFDSADNIPPDDPPKVIYHKPYQTFQDKRIEEKRRVLGKPPPKGSRPPIPPPPLPPGSYHQKPKYWRLRDTGVGPVYNKMAGVVLAFFVAVGYACYRYNPEPRDWMKAIGASKTPEEYYDYHDKWEHIKAEMFTHSMVNTMDVSVYGRFRNLRKRDTEVRWDLREVDSRLIGALPKDMWAIRDSVD